MAFSGTVGQTTFDTRKVIEHAMRLCRVPAQQITPEHIAIAKEQLFLMLSAWANENTPLWCIEKVLLPLYENTPAVTLPVGTVDILNANFRTMTEATGTETSTATTHTTALSTAALATTLGVLWSGASVPLALESSDDGVTWATLQSETPSASDGEWTWFDLDSANTALYFRVRATSGTLAVSRLYAGTTPSEIPLARMNRDSWTSFPNKSQTSSRPLQYWFDRQVRIPVMHMWPVPNAEATTSLLVAWRHRQIMDAGSLQQEVEVPQRWYDATVKGLAERLVIEVVEADISRQPLLAQLAAQALYLARNEERDSSPITIAPNIAMYTA